MADAKFMTVASTAIGVTHGLKGQTESYTTALWTNIVSFYFPLNVNDANGKGGFMMNHEFYGDYGTKSKCDLVLVHSSLPKPATKVYVPLLCVEAKSVTGSLPEARTQLLTAGTNILVKSELARPDGRNIQQCFGAVASGTRFQLYEFDIRGDDNVTLIDPVMAAHNYGGREMNLANQADRLILERFLQNLKYAHEFWFQKSFP